MSKEATLTEPAAKPATDNQHLLLAEEIRLKHPECITALRAFVNRKKAERKLKEAA